MILAKMYYQGWGAYLRGISREKSRAKVSQGRKLTELSTQQRKQSQLWLAALLFHSSVDSYLHIHVCQRRRY